MEARRAGTVWRTRFAGARARPRRADTAAANARPACDPSKPRRGSVSAGLHVRKRADELDTRDDLQVRRTGWVQPRRQWQQHPDPCPRLLRALHAHGSRAGRECRRIPGEPEREEPRAQDGRYVRRIHSADTSGAGGSGSPYKLERAMSDRRLEHVKKNCVGNWRLTLTDRMAHSLDCDGCGKHYDGTEENKALALDENYAGIYLRCLVQEAGRGG